jgi:hypothetical protein
VPFTVNGIGTTMCPGRGLISWQPGNWLQRGGTYDYDGVASFCIFYLPIIPYSAVHVYGRASQGMGERFMQLPIRWSPILVVRAFAYRWFGALCVAGIFCGVIAFVTPDPFGDNFVDKIAFETLGGIMIAAAGFGWWLLHWTDRRNYDLRRVMIATPFGSSDPVTWTDKALKVMNPPTMMFGTATFREAAEKAFDAGEFGRAMLAARYCAALEDRQAGESLTDDILRDPEVLEALPIVHRDPMRWKEHFGKGTDAIPNPVIVSAANPPSSAADDRIRPASDGSR